MIKVLSAVFIPPLGVYLQTGIGQRFFLNILLTCLGIIPGVVHAIWGLSEEKKRVFWPGFIGKVRK